MAKKITELPDATLPLAAADLLPVVQGGVTKKAPISAIAGVVAKAFNSANVSIPTGAFTVVPLNTTIYEAGGESHSDTVNNSRLIAPVPGFYLCGSGAVFAFNATGRRMLRIMKNGSTPIALDTRQAVTSSSGGTGMGSPVTPVQLVAGDYLTLEAYQDSGSSLDIVATAEYSPMLWMVRVMPA